MNIQDFKLGMTVRYENQKWKGIVIGIREDEVQVHFEGEEFNEYIDPMFLRAY